MRPKAFIRQASRIKKKRRATQDEMRVRRREFYWIVKAMKPMTVRQVFYQATVRGIVEKTENGYDKVQRELAYMRRNRCVFMPGGDRAITLPYDWKVDKLRTDS